jgi:putative FmdB family regulatory protein
MPTYEYLCKTCSHRFETWQKMTDEPLTVCPECGAHIRRVLYPAGVVFKGSGFYKTDHGNNGKLANAKGGENSKTESNGAAAEGGSTGEGKSSESKSSEGAASGGSKTGSESKPPATGASKVA